jgi:DNA (cytosine-5)-methyltransferase 1
MMSRPLPDGNRMFVSLFAGIEGFGLALEEAGWQCHTRVEIDDYCNRVTRGWIPFGREKRDVRRTAGGRFQRVGLVCGGFPCQDLSVAGKRKGLAGKRSGLFHEMVRIVAEARPRWLLWENVPGLLSSDEGRDFWRVNAALAEVGYFGAWRVLDSQYFGVAQRRRRLFGLYAEGDTGARRAAAVLLESEGGGWNPKAGGGAGQGDRGSPAGGVEGAGGEGDVSKALNCHKSEQVNDPSFATIVPVANTLQASMGHHGHSSPRGDGQDNIVVSPLGMSGHNGGMMPNTDAVAGGHLVTAFTQDAGGRLRETSGGGLSQSLESQDDLSYALTNPGGGGRTNCGQILAPCLNSGGNDGGFRTEPGQHLVEEQAGTVRRLTPTECERLQGFPVGWTIPRDKWTGWTLPKGLDSARYRALGNAATTNVIYWIVLRINMAEDLIASGDYDE